MSVRAVASFHPRGVINDSNGNLNVVHPINLVYTALFPLRDQHKRTNPFTDRDDLAIANMIK